MVPIGRLLFGLFLTCARIRFEPTYLRTRVSLHGLFLLRCTGAALLCLPALLALLAFLALLVLLALPSLRALLALLGESGMDLAREESPVVCCIARPLKKDNKNPYRQSPLRE